MTNALEGWAYDFELELRLMDGSNSIDCWTMSAEDYLVEGDCSELTSNLDEGESYVFAITKFPYAATSTEVFSKKVKTEAQIEKLCAQFCANLMTESSEDEEEET